MRRMFAIAAIFALAAPTMATAQEPAKGRPAAKPGPARPVAPPHGPVGHGPVVHGPVVHGPVVHGPVVHGPVVHGPVVHGPVVHGPVVHGPVGHGPVVHGPVGGPVHVGGPGVGHAPWMFHGHSYAWHPVHFPRPWVYPAGYGYRLWAVGAILPPLFWAANSPYYYAGWADLGLPPPDPGFQYVEYGPDLLLVNVTTGEVVEVFPGAFN